MHDDYRLPSITADEALALHRNGLAMLLDLRKPEAAMRSGQVLAAAVRRDPFGFSHDDPLMASRHPIVVFCVHGHEVSRFGTAMLLLHGVQARYVEGGFTALIAAGADTVPLQRDEETGHA